MGTFAALKGRVALCAPLLLLAVPESGAGDELKSVLKYPISPGSIALLSTHTGESGAVARLKLALTHSSAEVRGVAARVINLGSLAGLLADAAAALDREADPDAAREEIRLLFSRGGSSYDETILAAARRLAPRLDRELVRI
ncbi:MAG: hypothetical protein ACRD3M_16190, partial [Thermoanaerobaculia bacterium]